MSRSTTLMGLGNTKLHPWARHALVTLAAAALLVLLGWWELYTCWLYWLFGLMFGMIGLIGGLGLMGLYWELLDRIKF